MPEVPVTIEFTVEEKVALARIVGGRLNIYRRSTHEALYRAMQRFLRDDALSVMVLSTPPGQSWSAGDDISEFEESYGDGPDWSELLTLLPRDKPVIAAVRGYCLGQGISHLLRLTDIRYAAPDAKLGVPEIKYGIGGAGAILAEYMPSTLALEMALTGDLIDAEQAVARGLVNAVIADDALEAHAMAVARQIAAHPLVGLRAEMSPGPRLRGGRDPYTHLLDFQLLWQNYLADPHAKAEPPAKKGR